MTGASKSKGSHDGAGVPGPGGHSLPGRSRPQESAFARPALVAASGGHRQRLVSVLYQLPDPSNPNNRPKPQNRLPDRGLLPSAPADTEEVEGRHPLQRGTPSSPAFARAPQWSPLSPVHVLWRGFVHWKSGSCGQRGHRQRLRAPGSASRGVTSQGPPWSCTLIRAPQPAALGSQDPLRFYGFPRAAGSGL